MTVASDGGVASGSALSPDELRLLAWAAEGDRGDHDHAELASEIRARVRRLLQAGCVPGLALQLGLRGGLDER